MFLFATADGTLADRRAARARLGHGRSSGAAGRGRDSAACGASTRRRCPASAGAFHGDAHPRARDAAMRAGGDPLDYEGRVALDATCFDDAAASISRPAASGWTARPSWNRCSAPASLRRHRDHRRPARSSSTTSSPCAVNPLSARRGCAMAARGRRLRGGRRARAAADAPPMRRRPCPTLTDAAAAEVAPPAAEDRQRTAIEEPATGVDAPGRAAGDDRLRRRRLRQGAGRRHQLPPRRQPRAARLRRRSVRAGGELARRGRVDRSGRRCACGNPRFVNGFLPRSAGIGGTPSFLLNTANVDFRYTSPELPVMVFTRVQLVPRLEGARRDDAPVPRAGVRPHRADQERASWRSASASSTPCSASNTWRTRRTSASASRRRCSRATRPGRRSASRRSTAIQLDPDRRRRSASTRRRPTAARSSRRCRARRAA